MHPGVVAWGLTGWGAGLQQVMPGLLRVSGIAAWDARVVTRIALNEWESLTAGRSRESRTGRFLCVVGLGPF